MSIPLGRLLVGEKEKSGCGSRLMKTADACSVKALRRREKKRKFGSEPRSCLHGKPTGRPQSQPFNEPCSQLRSAPAKKMDWRSSLFFAGHASVCKSSPEKVCK